MKALSTVFLMIFAPFCLAAAQSSSATQLAIATFHKYKANVTSLPSECLSFYEEGPAAGESEMDLTVREKHGGKCGGDPSTAPAVAHLRVKAGKVLIMDIVSGDYRVLDSQYKSEY